MQFFHIEDARANTSMYKLLSNPDVGFANNFYCLLVSKLAPLLLDKKKQNRDSESSSVQQYTIMGNLVVYSPASASNPHPQLIINYNRVQVPGTGGGLKWLQDAIVECFNMEAKGTLTIQRPEGRSRANDRADFKKAQGTFLPKLYKKVTRDDSGIQDLGSMRKGTANKKPILFGKDYLLASNRDEFIEKKNEKCTYYVSKKVHCVDITEEKVSASKAMYAMNHWHDNEKSADLVFECKPLLQVVAQPDHECPYYVIVSGEHAFFVTSNRHTPTGIEIRNINVPSDLKGMEKKKEYRNYDVDPVYMEYTRWLKENGHKHQSERLFNEFKKSKRYEEVSHQDDIEALKDINENKEEPSSED